VETAEERDRRDGRVFFCLSAWSGREPSGHACQPAKSSKTSPRRATATAVRRPPAPAIAIAAQAPRHPNLFSHRADTSWSYHLPSWIMVSHRKSAFLPILSASGRPQELPRRS
jgi:hypothetical protein